MAHESFEDAETARLMNALFVNIKVDREERPDIDHIYMSALHAIGQQGGWPLTMFLTPDGEPMFGGTYWPPEPRYGRPSFRQVLQSVDATWRTRRDEMEQRGLTLADHLAKLSALSAGAGRRRPPISTRIGDALLSAVDPVHGGLRGAPKFPNAPIFRFFWSEMFRRGDPRFGEAVRAMLDAMNAGGIYDHLGGGFARYSTDAEWLVPHFEKMLYDNAQILELLALVHALWPDPTFAERARETFDWLKREMRVGDAFAASLDADQDGEEGLFYVWRETRSTPLWAKRRLRSRPPMTWRAGETGRAARCCAASRRAARREEEAALAASRARLFALRESASQARPRRQGPRRLERPDDRRARPRRRRVRRAGVARRRRAPRSILCLRNCATRTGASCTPGARAIRAPARSSTITPRWRAPRLAFRGDRRAARPRSRARPCERGARSLRRRRGRPLSHRARRRRRARRASAPGA